MKISSKSENFFDRPNLELDVKINGFLSETVLKKVRVSVPRNGFQDSCGSKEVVFGTPFIYALLRARCTIEQGRKGTVSTRT